MGLPIPFMFFADTDDGRIEIVDGAQRTQTLRSEEPRFEVGTLFCS